MQDKEVRDKSPQKRVKLKLAEKSGGTAKLLVPSPRENSWLQFSTRDPPHTFLDVEGKWVDCTYCLYYLAN